MYFLEHHRSSQEDYTAEAVINLSNRSDRQSACLPITAMLPLARPNYWNLPCLTLP